MKPTEGRGGDGREAHQGGEPSRLEGPGRLAAALSAALRALAEVQESQSRIEHRQEKAAEELARRDQRSEQLRSSLINALEGIGREIKSFWVSTDHLKKALFRDRRAQDYVWQVIPKRFLFWAAIFAFGILIGFCWCLSRDRNTLESNRRLNDQAHALNSNSRN